MTSKPEAGRRFPDVAVPRLGGGEIALGQPQGGHDWQMVVVYRGKHCPICAIYLTSLERLAPRLHGVGIDVVLVSGDPEEKAAAFAQENGLTLPVGYGLSLDAMRQLGLYISEPRSPQETDHPFAEPGLFVVNGAGDLHLVDISNAPFARPDLEMLANGLQFVREKDYPVRGTLAA